MTDVTPAAAEPARSAKGVLTQDLLDRLLLFKGADHDSLLGLLQDCRIRLVETDEVLIEAGRENKTLFIVLEGSLRVHLNRLDAPCITLLGVGECAGEMSLIEGERASAFVVAHESCRLLTIDKELLWTLINASHSVARNLLYILSGRLRRGNGLLAVGHELQQLYEQYAKVDALTGLHNRRWLDEVLHRLVARYSMNRHPLTVIMGDVDGFKGYNDSYGHLAGDRALHAVAQALSRQLRPTDMAARYGGEEFVVLLPDTALTEGEMIAERLRKAVEIEPIRASGGRPLPSVTISLGLAELAPGDTAEMVVSAADRALYRAKEGGRNRVER